MEALLQCKELRSDLRALAAPEAGIGARQLERALPSFSTRIGEEGAVEAGALSEAQRKLGLALVIVEVRRVDEARLWRAIVSTIAGWL